MRTVIEVFNLLILIGIISFIFFFGGIGAMLATTTGVLILMFLFLVIIGVGVWFFTKRNEGEPRDVLGRIMAIIPLMNAVIVLTFTVCHNHHFFIL